MTTHAFLLHITTENGVGLLEEASQYITKLDGSIIDNAVRVAGTTAVLLLYFELSDDKAIQQIKEDFTTPRRALPRMQHAELLDGTRPVDTLYYELESKDAKGLLANLSGVIKELGFDIIVHDGHVEATSPRYIQRLILGTTRLDQLSERVVIDGKRVPMRDAVTHRIESALKPYDGNIMRVSSVRGVGGRHQ